MLLNRVRFCVFFILIGLVYPAAHAKVVGSITAVSLEPSIFFPSADTDNLIQGFAWLKNGFTLEDSLTTCTFDALYPVSGTIDLNGGVLHLAQDLLGNSGMTIGSVGSIFANNYVIDLASSVTYLPVGPCALKDVYISLNNNVEVDSTITVLGTCVFEGNNHTMHIGDPGSIMIAPGARLVLRHATIKGLSGTQVACADDSASLELSDVIIKQDGDFSFSHGSILFCNAVDMNGSYTFTYDSCCTSTVSQFSTVRFFDGTRLRVGRKKAVDYVEPIAFIDKTSRIVLDNCDLEVTGTGVGFTRGEIVFQRNVNCYIASSDREHGVILGDGDPEHDVRFYFSPGCKVLLASGGLTYRNGSSDQIKASARTARLSRTDKSYVYIDRDCVINGITIELLCQNSPAMDVLPGVSLSYRGSSVIAPGVQFDLIAEQVGEYTYLLGGSQVLSLTKGLLPAAIVIAGKGNSIEGTGAIWGPILFQDADAELLWCGSGYVINQMNLNGGTLVLRNKLFFCADGCFSGAGTVNLGMSSLLLCDKESELTPAIHFVGETGVVEFREKLSLKSTCTFEGSCIFGGQNGVLDLKSGGELVVASGSTLKLRDMTILGVNGKKIRCEDDTAVLELSNVRMVLDDDYVFDAGSMLFRNTVAFSGEHVFSYESKSTSTIAGYATLCFDHGITCSVSRPQLDDSVGPFVCEDSSSALSFDNSTFFVHTNGAKFIKGTIYCYRDLTIDIISTSSENGLELGDGTPEGDMVFQFMPGSAVIYPRGHVVYNVTRPDGLRSNSPTSRIVRLDDSVFYLKNDCTIANLTVEATRYALFETTRDGGGHAVLAYDKGAVSHPRGTFEVSGERYNAYTNYLKGDGYLLLTKGYLPSYTLVQGANNSIYGNGDVLCNVILLGSQAQLIWSLNGLMMDDILLNGGQLRLTTDLNFSDANFIRGPGVVDMNGKAIWCGESDLFVDEPTNWHSDSAKCCIELHRDLALSACWTFSGLCCVNGNFGAIDLAGGGELVADYGSTMILKNVTIKNISGDSIRCLDDAGQIILENVTLIHSDDALFEHGSIVVHGNAAFRGQGKQFAYRSNMPSIINADSRLTLDNLFTFSYDPVVPVDDLLRFENHSSLLVLRGATLHSACSAGLAFIKGHVDIVRRSCFSSDCVMVEGELVDPGVSIGDGVAEHDVVCVVESGSSLCVAHGSLNYKNVKPESFLMHGFNSNLLMRAGTTLRLYQNVDLGSGYISFGDGATLAYVEGMNIVGSTGQEGVFHVQELYL